MRSSLVVNSFAMCRFGDEEVVEHLERSRRDAGRSLGCRKA